MVLVSSCTKQNWDENTTSMKLEFKLVVNDSDPDHMILSNGSVINNFDLEKAHVVNDYIGNPVIEIIMTAGGKKEFGRFTEQHIDKKLAIVLNGEILSAPTIVEPIYGGNAWIVMPDKNDRKELQEIVAGIIKYRDTSKKLEPTR